MSPLHPFCLTFSLLLLLLAGAGSGFLTFMLIPGKVTPKLMCNYHSQVVTPPGEGIIPFTFLKGGDATFGPRNTLEAITAAVETSNVYMGATLDVHVTNDSFPIVFDRNDAPIYLSNSEVPFLNDFNPSLFSWQEISQYVLTDGDKTGSIPQLGDVLAAVCTESNNNVNLNIRIPSSVQPDGIVQIVNTVLSSPCNVPITVRRGAIVFSLSYDDWDYNFESFRSIFGDMYQRPFSISFFYNEHFYDRMGLYWHLKTRWFLYYNGGDSINGIETDDTVNLAHNYENSFKSDGYCVGTHVPSSAFSVDTQMYDYLIAYEPQETRIVRTEYSARDWVWGLFVALTVLSYIIFLLSIVWTVFIYIAWARGLHE